MREPAEHPSSRAGEPWGNLGQAFLKDFFRKAWGNHAAEQLSSRPGEPGEPWGNLGGTSGEPWGNLGQAFLKDFLRKAWGNHAAEQPSSRGNPGGLETSTAPELVRTP